MTRERTILLVGDARRHAAALGPILTRLGFRSPSLAPSLSVAVAMQRSAPVDVIVLPVDGLGASDVTQIEQEWRGAGPALLGVGPGADPTLLLTAMRAGITEFLAEPLQPSEVEAAIDRMVRRMGPPHRAGGGVFAVYSAKGGLGTTTVALNLAVAAALADPAQRVALADFVVVGGDLRVLLDLPATYDIGDLVAKIERVDGELLNSVLAAGPHGIGVLPSSDKVELLDRIDAGVATSILAALRQHFGAVVVDTEHYLGERTLSALDAADHILLVTQLSVAALRSTQRTLPLFDRLGYGPDKLQLVVNRMGAESPLSLKDAEAVLDRPIHWTLPNDFELCASAVTRGRPVIQLAPDSRLGRSYLDLARRLLVPDRTAAGATAPGGGSPARDASPATRAGRLFRLSRS